MCRSIKPLFNFDPPIDEEEIRAAALQFVRKISGFTKPSKANEAIFFAAVDEIARASAHLLSALETNPRRRTAKTKRPRRGCAQRRDSGQPPLHVELATRIEGPPLYDYDYLMESSAPGLPLKVQLSKADLFRAALRRQIHSAVFWIVPLAVICVALTSFRGNPNGGIAAVCVGLAMLAIMPLSAPRASAKNPGVLAPITYVFDDCGVSAIFFNGETHAQ